MTKAQLRALRDRLYLHDEIAESALDADSALLPPGRGLRRLEYLAAAAARARRPAPRPGGAGRAACRAPTPRPSPSSRRARAARRSRPPWPSPACCGPWCATRRWARCVVPDRLRRGPHLRAGVAHQRGRRSTRPRASATPRSTPTSPCTTPRAPRARSSRRGSPRPGALATFTAARHLLRHLGRAHGARLPLLFHVRVPAGRRPALGARRHARPRLPGSAARPGAPRSTGEGSSTRTASRRCSPRPTRRPAYDPAFAYEVAAIVEDGIRRMTGPEPEDRFWYLTLYNENYPMPALPEGAEAERRPPGHHRRPLPLRAGARRGRRRRATACGRRCASPGPSGRVAVEARRLLAER